MDDLTGQRLPGYNAEVSSLTSEDIEALASVARCKGFPSLSDYVNHLCKDMREPLEVAHEPPMMFHSTPMGTIWHGNSLGYMASVEAASVDLVMTSPP